MRISKIVLALMATALLAGPVAAQAPVAGGGQIYGVWRNPKNSVHVDVRPCGPSACGYVVWANAEAQADARDGGTPNLIGLQLFRNFNPQANGRWRGKVFVPDLNATFSGTAELLDEDRLRARGCLIANIACKSQVWVRVAAPR
ncbi:DUF2147 domain-containing protein [Phenylobacterium sp. J426]|uniref:DUF2147 domain-containing protein n=1 Tax=Phenylobacterium sp. J426 TaxID=2898439 RepID=UPI002151B811|nr:DUF2147 domain-containing protein [Phenylobacterium sp. J426]MCR5875705.1 DUF2147 domain-containing protein [Phenylobacterium sp. J426]